MGGCSYFSRNEMGISSKFAGFERIGKGNKVRRVMVSGKSEVKSHILLLSKDKVLTTSPRKKDLYLHDLYPHLQQSGKVFRVCNGAPLHISPSASRLTIGSA